MIAYFTMSLSWGELMKRTYAELTRDDAQGMAAQLAYYFFLALFPALLCLLAIASFFPLSNFTDDMVTWLGPFAPAAMLDLISQQMVAISEGEHGGLLGIGFLGALWSSSAAMVGLSSAMNKAYDIEESRPWWKVRLTAILLTVGLAVFVLIAFTLIVAGPQLADLLSAYLGLGQVFVWTWKTVQWPLAAALVSTAFGLIYYFAPDAEQDWVWITPGALTAALLWFAGSLAFRFYAVNFGNYEASYGTIGGIILLLLWFYLSGMVIVIGAEMNAEIEHASPWGKAPGERVPGQKKRLGSAAARYYAKAARAQTPPPVPAPPLALPPHEAPGVLETMLGSIALFVRWRSKAR